MQVLSLQQSRHLHLRAQCLFPRRSDVTPARLVADVCGIQAQDPFAARLALWVRGAGLRSDQVDAARLRERTVVRTWAMRGTLHWLASEDLAWLLPLLGPAFIHQSRRRYAQLGLTEDVCASAVRAIGHILGSQGPRTRADLAEQLLGLGFPAEGQAAYHLLRRAGLEGLICYGPDSGGEHTFVRIDDWLPARPAVATESGPVELARRYLAAYGPAKPEDLAAWSGLTKRRSQEAFKTIGDELLEVESAGAPAWLLQSRSGWLALPRPKGPVVRLLPAFDIYLLGYRGRNLSVPQRYASHIHPGGGILRPALLVDGYAAGTWQRKQGSGGLLVTVEPFQELADEVTRAVAAEVQDLGRFLGEPTSLHFAPANDSD